MARDKDAYNWGIVRIRARNAAYTVVQLFGFVLVFWGIFEVIGRATLEYYRRESSLPAVVDSAANAIPTLDVMTGIIMFGAGAAIVWLATR